MSESENYGQEYFEEIYARLKKEKGLVLRSFFDLLVQESPEIKNVLDLGCGEGEFLKTCQDAQIECFGVDISSYALKEARKRIKGELRELDLEKETLPWPSGFFDAVTAFDIVEHIKDPGLALREARRVLKGDGVLFLTTLNGGYWPAGFLGHFVTDDPTHVNVQKESYWRKLIEKAGFSEIKIKGSLLFGFPPGMELRHFLKRLKIPVLTRPIFFPIMGLTAELFVWARK